MALKKEIELENGIITNYHRIISLNKIVNFKNIIEIGSYVSKQKRESEKEYYLKGDLEEPMCVYINSDYIEKDYNDEETIADSYNYLKTLDKFKDASDI